MSLISTSIPGRLAKYQHIEGEQKQLKRLHGIILHEQLFPLLEEAISHVVDEVGDIGRFSFSFLWRRVTGAVVRRDMGRYGYGVFPLIGEEQLETTAELDFE